MSSLPGWRTTAARAAQARRAHSGVAYLHLLVNVTILPRLFRRVLYGETFSQILASMTNATSRQACERLHRQTKLVAVACIACALGTPGLILLGEVPLHFHTFYRSHDRALACVYGVVGGVVWMVAALALTISGWCLVGMLVVIMRLAVVPLEAAFDALTPLIATVGLASYLRVGSGRRLMAKGQALVCFHEASNPLRRRRRRDPFHARARATLITAGTQAWNAGFDAYQKMQREVDAINLLVASYCLNVLPLALTLWLGGHEFPRSTGSWLRWFHLMRFLLAQLVGLTTGLLFPIAVPMLASALTMRKLCANARRLVCEDVVSSWCPMVDVMRQTGLCCYSLGGMFSASPTTLLLLAGSICVASDTSLAPYVALFYYD